MILFQAKDDFLDTSSDDFYVHQVKIQLDISFYSTLFKKNQH